MLKIVVFGIVEANRIAVFYKLGVDRIGVVIVAGVHPAAVGLALRLLYERDAVRVGDRVDVGAVAADVGRGFIARLFKEVLHHVRNGDAFAGVRALEDIRTFRIRSEALHSASVDNDRRRNFLRLGRRRRLVDVPLAGDLDGCGDHALVERFELFVILVRRFGVQYKLLVVLRVLRVGQPALDRNLGVVLRLRQKQTLIRENRMSAGVVRAVVVAVVAHRVVAGVIVGVDALDVLDLTKRRIAVAAVRILDDFVERVEVLRDVALVGVFAADGVPIDLFRCNLVEKRLGVADFLIGQRRDRKGQNCLAEHRAGYALAVFILLALADLHLDLCLRRRLVGQRAVDDDVVAAHLCHFRRQALNVLRLLAGVVEDAGGGHFVEIRQKDIVLDGLRQINRLAEIIVVDHKTGQQLLEVPGNNISRVLGLGRNGNAERAVKLERAGRIVRLALHRIERVIVQIAVEERDQLQIEGGRFLTHRGAARRNFESVRVFHKLIRDRGGRQRRKADLDGGAANFDRLRRNELLRNLALDDHAREIRSGAGVRGAGNCAVFIRAANLLPGHLLVERLLHQLFCILHIPADAHVRRNHLRRAES